MTDDATMAETDLVCISADGKRRPIRVEIGCPQPSGPDFECHVAIRGSDRPARRVLGGDPIQCVAHALAMIRANLKHLTRNGCRITFPGDDRGTVDIDALSFGALTPRRRRSQCHSPDE